MAKIRSFADCYFEQARKLLLTLNHVENQLFVIHSLSFTCLRRIWYLTTEASWSSGIVSSYYAGGPGFNPQENHVNYFV